MDTLDARRSKNNMKNPVAIFFVRMVLAFALILGVFKLAGLQDLNKKAFRTMASVKYGWLGKTSPIRFTAYESKNALNNDSQIVKPPDAGFYTLNTQKFSLRFFILLLVLTLSIPGSWKPKLKQVFWTFFLFYLFLSLKQLISILYTARLNGWELSLGLPEFIAKNLVHLERFVVMSSHFNLLVVFSIWILICYNSIRQQFLPQSI